MQVTSRWRLIAALLGVLIASALLPGDVYAQESGDKPTFAVVVRHTGEASSDDARDLQEILIAAFSGRGEFQLIGKGELAVKAGIDEGDEETLIKCLINTPCVDKMRRDQNIKYLVLGKIETSSTHHEFSIERFSDLPEPYTKVVKVPLEDGVDGLLDALYSIAAEMPLDDVKPASPPEKSVEGEVKNATNKSSPVVVAPPKEKPLDTTDRGLGIPGYAAIGLGVVAGATLGGGLIFNQRVVDAKEQLQTSIDGTNTRAGAAQGLTRSEAKRLETEANDNATFANVFYGISLGAAISSGVLVFIEVASGDQESPSTSAAKGLRPDIGADRVGLSWAIDF